MRMGRGDERTDEPMDGWTDRWTDCPCVLQDFVPFGAAALLPLNLNHTVLQQGMGTADHLLRLECYHFFAFFPFFLRLKINFFH